MFPDCGFVAGNGVCAWVRVSGRSFTGLQFAFVFIVFDARQNLPFTGGFDGAVESYAWALSGARRRSFSRLRKLRRPIVTNRP